MSEPRDPLDFPIDLLMPAILKHSRFENFVQKLKEQMAEDADYIAGLPEAEREQGHKDCREAQRDCAVEYAENILSQLDLDEHLADLLMERAEA